jgi:hypothetical protein
MAGAQPSAELIDVSFVHRAPVLPQHFGKVFGKDIDLLLQKKERRFDRTQLSLVNDKGEFFHRDPTALMSIQGYSRMRQKQGNGRERAKSPKDSDSSIGQGERMTDQWMPPLNGRFDFAHPPGPARNRAFPGALPAGA